MSETDLEIAELKESTRRLEAEINALIERSPALRKAVERERIERLKARSHELLVKILVQQKNTKKKSEFLYLRGGIHSIVPMENERMSVLVNETDRDRMRSAAAAHHRYRLSSVAGFQSRGRPSFVLSHRFFLARRRGGRRGLSRYLERSGQTRRGERRVWIFFPHFPRRQKNRPALPGHVSD